MGNLSRNFGKSHTLGTSVLTSCAARPAQARILYFWVDCGFLCIFCCSSFGPEFGHHEPTPNPHQAHTKPTLWQTACAHETHTKPRSSRDGTQAGKKARRPKPTPNPRQAYIKPTTQQTAGAHIPTTQQTLCPHHGPYQTQTKPIKRGQDARQTKT